jgi:hypothetical protein
MKTEVEIEKELARLQKITLKGEPYSEMKRVAIQAAKQALEWTIEEKGAPITF